MKKILITISEDLIVRNIILTDFWSVFLENNKGNSIILVVKPDRKEYFERVFSAPNVVIDTFSYQGPSSRSESAFFSLARSAIKSHTNLWSKMRSYKRGESGFFITYLKRAHTFLFGGLNWYKFFLRWCIIQTRSHKDAVRLFNTHNPDIILSLSITNFNFDVLLLKEAKKRGIFTIGMTRSWDNLSSHGLLRVIPDTLIVQNVFLKDMAIEHQAVNEKKTPIHVVGLPHYDCLKELDKIIQPRETFLKSMSLDPSKKIVMYGAMGGFLFLHEDEMPDVLEDIVEKKLKEDNVQVLYRAHPKFMIESEKLKTMKHVVMDTGGKFFDDTEGSRISKENIRLINSIYHSDVLVTGASTMAIDAAILDKPIICVGFNGKTLEQDVDRWESIRRFYDLYTHFEVLMETGGVRYVDTPDELTQQIRVYLKNPEQDSEGRKKIIQSFVEPFDRQAGKRLAHIVSQTIIYEKQKS